MGGWKSKLLKDKEKFADIPEDIMIEVLAKIPANLLWEKIRYTCKSWYEEICSSEFIYKHNAIHQKSAGILIQFYQLHWSPNYYFTYNTYFLEMVEDKFEWKLNSFRQKATGYISSSYNGLIVEAVFDADKPTVVHVKNILTGFDLTLPDTHSGCRHFPDCELELGFNPNTKEYKVVHIHGDTESFEMFTIGVDKAWRRVTGPFHGYRRGKGVNIGGQFLHWSTNVEYIISLDIWDEKISKTKFPPLGMGRIPFRYNSNIAEMDGKLCFIQAGFDFKIEVWVLKDFSRQVWSKQHSMHANCTNFKASIWNLRVVATLKNGMVIIFQDMEFEDLLVLYSYDMKRREIGKVKTKGKRADRFIPHHLSLVSL